MRIGLVIGEFNPRRGGAEQSTAELAIQLAARGHEVHVVAQRFGDSSNHLPVVLHEVGRAGGRVGFAHAAAARLGSLELDVVHDMGAGWYCDVFQPRGGSWIAVQERKLLLTPRWMRPWKRAFDRTTPRHRQFRNLLARQYADDERILVAMSRMTAAHFRELHGVRPERIRLIYNGVDTQRFSPQHRARYRRQTRRRLAVDDDTLVLLIVANNFALKGVPSLLCAMSRLVAGGAPVHLVVVGGKRSGRYRRCVKRMGIAGSVTFTGLVDDTVAFYAAADVCVHPALYDNCSRVVLEALSSGLPVVTSRFNGAAELLTHGVDGFVVSDPADVDELLVPIQQLLDARVRHGMGEAARQLALRHTPDHNCDQVVAVYSEIIGRRRRAA